MSEIQAEFSESFGGSSEDMTLSVMFVKISGRHTSLRASKCPWVQPKGSGPRCGEVSEGENAICLSSLHPINNSPVQSSRQSSGQ